MKLPSAIPANLAVLMLTAFMDMVGVLMLLPLLPFYAKDLGATGFVMAWLGSSFLIAQLISAPLWGRVSDRYGRKPALVIGLSASAVAYVVFAFADSLWLLFVSRIIQGAGGGTVGVIQAYVSDVVEPKNRAKGLGWLSAATNVGVMIGPLIGSAASTWGRHAPGLIAAGVCVLNIAFAWRFLGESHNAAMKAKARHERWATVKAVWRIAPIWPVTLVTRLTLGAQGAAGLTHPNPDFAKRFIWVYAIAIGAFYGLTLSGVMPFFLMERHGITEKTIGPFFAYIGVLNVVFRIGLLGKVIDRFGEARATRLGIISLALGFAVMPFTSSLITLAIATALLPLGATLLFPCVTAMLSQVVGDHERGLYMGLQQTVGNITRVVYALFAGTAWDLGHARFGQAGSFIPFFASAALVATTALLAVSVPEPAKEEGVVVK
ncbi:MAG TPA: MFS transporter [Gemmatimonadaceae bacterium]|nr:MFS transporter [Gemmatimonadaceae bacterium]